MLATIASNVGGFGGCTGPSTAATRQALDFDEGYLKRLRSGDEETAAHFNDYFRRLLRRWVWGKFNREQEEELVDSAMTAAFEKIRQGQPREATRLAAYVTGICVNRMRLALRPSFNTHGQDPEKLHIQDQTRNPEEKLIENERAHEVREVLGTLGQRDRDVLVDLFYHEKDRAEVCEKHGVDRKTLRLILFRARKRFQNHWNVERV